MQFNVDQDSGHAVSGWIIPDNPTHSARIIIRSPGRPDAEVAADLSRVDIRDLGLHATGKVGFAIGDAVVPGISGLKEFDLIEYESQILFYRRAPQENYLQKKVVQYKFNIIPEVKIEGELRNNFCMTYSNVEKIPFDSMFAIINNQFSTSIHLSGHPLLTRYESLLRERDYITTALFRNPFEELAERLIVLDFVASKNVEVQRAERLIGALQPALAFARHVVAQPMDAHAIFKTIPDPVESALRNPYTRALACEVGEPEEYRHIAIALERLADMSVVGTRDRFDFYRELLAETLSRDVMDGHAPSDIPGVDKLAASFAKSSNVQKLLELDLALYERIDRAVGNSENPQ